MSVTNEISSHPHHPYIFLFIGCALLTAGIIKSSRVRVPLTIALFIVGAVCGIIGDLFPTFQLLLDPIHVISPSFLFYIFFPVLIFEAAFNCEVAVFQLVWKEIICLAVPGILLSTALTGTFIKLVIYRQWNWSASLLYGAIISATDPVATLGILKELGGNERTRAILDGESILNDGIAIVLYEVLVPFVENVAGGPERAISFFPQFLQCVHLVFGALLLGTLSGILMTAMLQRCSEKSVESTVIYAFGVISFFIAESWLKVSGVLTLCFLGLRFAIRRHVVHPHNTDLLNAFWEVLVYIANVLIFTIVGVYVSNQKFRGMQWYDYCMVPVLYAALMCIRFIMVFSLLGACGQIPGARKLVGIKDLIVISTNGLRGAVALTLALVIRHDKRITDTVLKQQFLLLTAGQVCFTVVLNGLLCKPIIRFLGLKSRTREEEFAIVWAWDRIGSQLKANQKKLEESQISPGGCDFMSLGNDIPSLFPTHSPTGLEGIWNVMDERTFHEIIYHRLLHNLSVALFEKGFISSTVVHTVTFQAKQCLAEGRLLGHRDFSICTHSRFLLRMLRVVPLRWVFNQLKKRLLQETIQVLIGYKIVLDVLAESMTDKSTAPASSVKFCRMELYPRSFQRWIVEHLKRETMATGEEIEVIRPHMGLNEEQSTSLQNNRSLHRVSFRFMSETVDELMRGGLLDYRTGDGLIECLRAKEVNL
ncbi:sperm-specific sodium proton exchanger precursor [Perkinsela sp. CCAP 1560/4]|nr:sperm-specific sodium proton exchanger precursor [Perkinsela sp. CCAP 1560/4]|eukprot:KNH08455.1 sperm-specific sodium proton exchanger precursor [Perkinsela sp. CCAP 1560/4]